MRSEPILVRDANPTDAFAVSMLVKLLGYDANPDEVRKRLTSQSATGGSSVLVAVARGTTVGVIACSHPIPLLAEGGSFVRITVLAVAENHRGRGVGRCLVEEIERRAAAKGASLIEVSSGRRPERRVSHAFYPALGFVDSSTRSVVYRKQLSEWLKSGPAGDGRATPADPGPAPSTRAGPGP